MLYLKILEKDFTMKFFLTKNLFLASNSFQLNVINNPYFKRWSLLLGQRSAECGVSMLINCQLVLNGYLADLNLVEYDENFIRNSRLLHFKMIYSDRFLDFMEMIPQRRQQISNFSRKRLGTESMRASSTRIETLSNPKRNKITSPSARKAFHYSQFFNFLNP